MALTNGSMTDRQSHIQVLLSSIFCDIYFSVERLMDYASNVDQEPDWSVPAADDLLSPNWPETGLRSIFIFGFDS